MGNEAFDRYAPFIKDFIYRSRWDSLRGVQMAAADAIFNTDENVLLTSSTASGKTEAAFFPILTLLSEDPPASVGALYIGPLKALINDQFGRLTDLCREAGIPVWHWHGDVSQTHKEKLIRHPSGILQITPESLEGMLLHRHGDVARLFGDLRFIVIDEVHSLIKGDRGGQTLCLIERLSRLAGCNPRRIGLSATIGNPGRTGEFLAAGTGRGTAIPEVSEPGVRWRLSMEHFFIQGEQAVPAEGSDPLPPLDSATDRAPRNADPGYAYVFEHTRGRKCLVFSNSREECEEVCSTLRHYCEANREPDRFLIHHGNISPALRETAERAMRDETRDLTVCTTATLELGIDVGRLERAFQIDAPWTVSAFLQRMGRTGRRGQPPEMWFVMREDEAEARAMLPAAVPWTLIQGIALVQTYREDRRVEPPRLDRLPYSLLFHQTLCTLAGGGEMSPGVLAGRVLGLSYFHRVTRDDYRVLLRHLISTDMVERTGRGGLIVGLAGERLISSYRFLATFKENEEFTVRSESMELGTIVRPPPVGEKVAIAGRVWTVDTVDLKRHLLTVTEVKGRVPAFFGLEPGDMDTRILLRMRGVLSEDCSYPYLMANAVGRLAERLSSMISERTGRRRAVRLETPSGLCESLEWVRGLAAYDPSLAPLLPSAEESLRRDFRKGLEPFRSALEGRRVVLFAYIRRYPRVQMEVLEELGAEIVAVLREKPFVIDHNEPEPDFGSIRVMEEATVCDLRRLKEDEGFDLVVTNDPDRVSRAGFRWAPMGSRYMGLKGAVEWARTLADCIRLDPAGWEGSL